MRSREKATGMTTRETDRHRKKETGGGGERERESLDSVQSTTKFIRASET